jgi:hypothetical protein
LLILAKEAGVIDLAPVAQGGEVRQANINADNLVGGRQWVRRVKDRLPSPSLREAGTLWVPSLYPWTTVEALGRYRFYAANYPPQPAI